MASPTVHLDSVFVTAVMEAWERCGVGVADLPGAFLACSMEGKEEVLMVLRGRLAELMALTAPNIYQKYVTINSNGRKILYIKLAKALYGMN